MTMHPTSTSCSRLTYDLFFWRMLYSTTSKICFNYTYRKQWYKCIWYRNVYVFQRHISNTCIWNTVRYILQ